MRDLNNLDEFRRRHPIHGVRGDHGNGYFVYPRAEGALRILASNGGGWDHVSVSLEDRTPSWEEMDFVAKRFFKESETCVQYHVPKSDHINCAEHCLHLWRPRGGKPLPRPPSWMVGPK